MIRKQNRSRGEMKTKMEAIVKTTKPQNKTQNLKMKRKKGKKQNLDIKIRLDEEKVYKQKGQFITREKR